MTQTTFREYLRTTEDAISSGRLEEAMADCQNILKYFPAALEAQRLLGEVYLAQGHLEEAQQTFEWILTNDPENVIVYCDRALISERVSDIDTALDCYQQAYELSRGNANIRQEFNQLSARAGQQEFMFSRAGLARLYMRGDLLTQALQEWEAVLAIGPERLDARLGLLETYWREGMYDKAESVATQLLEEVPTCLKALLYMAHITSISNLQRARELLQRAEALDPELTIAQETFVDLAARQPNDPFLELIKREPVLLENGVPLNYQQIAPATPAHTPDAQNGHLPAEDAWDELDTWDRPTQTSLPTPKVSASVTENNQQVEIPVDQTSTSSAPEVLFGRNQQELIAQAAPEELPWYQHDQSAETHVSTQENADLAEAAWSDAPEGEEELPTPPAWLDTLTHSEQQSLAEETSQEALEEPAPIVRQPETMPVGAEATPIREDFTRITAEPEEAAQPLLLPVENEHTSEDEMGWPEWLKSLGAQPLETGQIAPVPSRAATDEIPLQPAVETPAHAAPQPIEEVSQPAPEEAEDDPWAALPAMSANNDTLTEPSGSSPEWAQHIEPVSSKPTESAAPDWMQQLSARENTPRQDATPDWMQQLSVAGNTPTPAATPDWMPQVASVEGEPFFGDMRSAPAVVEHEQRSINALAELEKGLKSEGFTPLTPGTLAALAQTQQNRTIQPPVAQPEPSLSSALAQLGNFPQHTAIPARREQSWWNAAAPMQSKEPPTQRPASEPINPFVALGARPAETVPQPFVPLPATPSPTPPAPVNASPAPVSPPPAPVNVSPAPVMQPVPVRHSEVPDSDLEMTMRRPAISLQPMQAAAIQNDRPYTQSKGRNERKYAERASGGNLSSHERLVKGYQYQLNGAYEEAMQNYRVIIRTAPELLDDVISNMRALLKINPSFSQGYRVLGDAYMRKGEYLQAMEAYNKALTMAKKARN